MFERNAANNFAVLGPFTRYEWQPSGGTGTFKLYPASGQTLADIHIDGAGVVPDRIAVGQPNEQAFGAFTFFVAQDTDFITTTHKIQSPATDISDVDSVLATKGYVDSIRGVSLPLATTATDQTVNGVTVNADDPLTSSFFEYLSLIHI